MQGPERSRRSAVMWYLRIALYVAILGLIVYMVHITRGRIPHAFGLTPISVKALSVDVTPSGEADMADMVDVAVSVRIIGRDSIATDVTLHQFHVETKSGDVYRPYASSLLFNEAGTLAIARGDTLEATLLFLIPQGDAPEELWWEP